MKITEKMAWAAIHALGIDPDDFDERWLQGILQRFRRMSTKAAERELKDIHKEWQAAPTQEVKDAIAEDADQLVALIAMRKAKRRAT